MDSLECSPRLVAAPQGWVLYGQGHCPDNPDLRPASRFRLELFEHLPGPDRAHRRQERGPCRSLYFRWR